MASFDFIEQILQERVDPRLSDLYQAIASLGEPLEQLAEGLSAEISEEIYAYWRQAGNTGAAGTDVQLEFQAVPGTAALITNLAFTGGVVAGVGGPCAIYIDSVTPGNLVYFIANAQIGAEKGIDLYVPPGRKLIFHFYAQPNNQACTITAVVKQLIRTPDKVIEGED